MTRQNQILAAVLALQIVVLLVLFWPTSSVARGEPIFGEIEADQIVRITVSNAEGQQVQLSEGPEGWGLSDADGFPAQQEKVVSLTEKIAGLEADRLVTRTSASHKRLGVDEEEFERLLEFELEDGTRHKLYLGTAPRFQVVHVRADGQDEVYLALGMAVSDAGAGPSAWINTSYFSVTGEQIFAITLENKNGRFEFDKDADDNWTMAGLAADENLLQNNVRSLTSRVSSIRMIRPLGREQQDSYGLDDPNAVVTIQTRDDAGNERTHVIRVGSQLEGDGQSGYVVKSATSPYYVLVGEFVVNDLIERTREDYLEPPPTPEPEPAEEPTPAP
jgi:hypothetical protein